MIEKPTTPPSPDPRLWEALLQALSESLVYRLDTVEEARAVLRIFFRHVAPVLAAAREEAFKAAISRCLDVVNEVGAHAELTENTQAISAVDDIEKGIKAL